MKKKVEVGCFALLFSKRKIARKRSACFSSKRGNITLVFFFLRVVVCALFLSEAFVRGRNSLNSVSKSKVTKIKTSPQNEKFLVSFISSTPSPSSLNSGTSLQST